MIPCRIHSLHFKAKLLWLCEWLNASHCWNISGHVCAFAYLQVKSLVVNSVTASTLHWDASVQLCWWRCGAKAALSTPELIDSSLALLHSWPAWCPNQDLFGLQAKKFYIKWIKRGKVWVLLHVAIETRMRTKWDLQFPLQSFLGKSVVFCLRKIK